MADAAQKIVAAVAESEEKAHEHSDRQEHARDHDRGSPARPARSYAAPAGDDVNGKNCYVAGVNPARRARISKAFRFFGSVKEAKRQTGATVSRDLRAVPDAAGAIDEAVDAGLDLVICITEGVPVRDMIATRFSMRGKKTLLVGPNCPA